MGQLNEWGNQLINQKNIDSALAVIILNTEIHPKVANTFDSLGVTYAVMKQFKQALSNYQIIKKYFYCNLIIKPLKNKLS